MKKTLATIGVASGLAIAGLGTAQVASAQTDDESVTEEETETTEGERDGERGDRNSRGDRDGDQDGERDGRRGRNGRGKNFEAVAEILGMEADEIRAQLSEGMSLADIAEANDVDPDELVDAMVASVSERLDAKVAEGDLTEDEAAEKLSAKTERIEAKVFDLEDEDSDSDDSDEADAEDADADDEEVEGEGS